MENKQINDDEIDLLALFIKIWQGRKTILRSFLICLLLGILVAILSSKEYTATCLVMPQSKRSGLGGLGGLATLAGINLSEGGDENITPKLYPTIAKTIPFKREMLQTTINIEELEEPITYAEYYEKYAKTNILGVLKKYTIGLPGVIISAFKGKEEEAVVEEGQESGILTISGREKNLLNQIDQQLNINYNEKEGIITLSFSMPEALASAQMLENVQQYLQNAVTEIKLDKVQRHLEFIEKRYAEAKEQYKAKQMALASFRDSNRGLISSLSQTQQSHLEFEFNMAFNVYNELSKQLETQKIKVKEKTPVFTIIEPVSVPTERSKPKRGLIVMIWGVLGIVIGVGKIFAKDFLQSFKREQIV